MQKGRCAVSEEWGPWIEHDGKWCPCKGQYAQWVWDNGMEREGIAGTRLVKARTGRVVGAVYGEGYRNAWIWATSPARKVICYRIRKPRGLTILEGLLEELPEGVDA